MSFLGGIFGSRRKEGAAPPGSIPVLEGSVDRLLREDSVIVFKHSTACPMSWAAHAHVTKFLRENPDAPVRMVKVIQERVLSQKIAEATGVRHESPQIIVLRGGEVAASASHGRITLDSLNEMRQLLLV